MNRYEVRYKGKHVAETMAVSAAKACNNIYWREFRTKGYWCEKKELKAVLIDEQ